MLVAVGKTQFRRKNCVQKIHGMRGQYKEFVTGQRSSEPSKSSEGLGVPRGLDRIYATQGSCSAVLELTEAGEAGKSSRGLLHRKKC
jgi:hypothetical protein